MNINNKFTFITIPLQSIQSKYDQLLSPSAALIHDMSKIKSDIIIPVSYTHLDVYKRQPQNHGKDLAGLSGEGISGQPSCPTAGAGNDAA